MNTDLYDDRPIGVFDSGIGGLTVVSELAARLPGESIVYLGDTARVPYGDKSPDTIIRYAREDAAFLVRHDVKLIVAACNTVSAVALDDLKLSLDVPVCGVIEAGAAATAGMSGKIAVIGTPATVASGAYPAEIAMVSPALEVECTACPLLVPLAEEMLYRGLIFRNLWQDSKVAAYLVSMAAFGSLSPLNLLIYMVTWLAPVWFLSGWVHRF